MAREPLLNLTTLRRLQTFPWASDQQLQKLLSQMSLQHVERRTVLFSEGTPAELVCLLISGVVKQSLRNPAGEDVLVSLVRPGELFGVSSLIPEMQHPFRSEAFSDCWVSRLRPQTLVTTLLGVSFNDFSALMSSTVNRWLAMLSRYAHFQGLSLRQRLALALVELAQKFGVQDARGTILILHLTHEDLADLVGASRQKVTEHLKEFERQQVILRDGRRLIVLPKRLQAIVNPSQES
ncbi:MAG: Crp/Fnr family transcriptional regulator [Candidatus Binatia bacterium]